MKKETGYIDGSAYGQAPMGPANMGQSADEPYPGNGRMSIDRSNPNPSERALRVDALYATTEKRGQMKREEGSRMAGQVKANNDGVLGRKV